MTRDYRRQNTSGVDGRVRRSFHQIGGEPREGTHRTCTLSRRPSTARAYDYALTVSYSRSAPVLLTD